MNSLESRKQLLVAESELNRAQLLEEMAALTAGVRSLTDRAQSFGAIASAAAMLVTGLAAFRRTKSVLAAAKPSWLQTILKGAGLVSTLWLAFRSQRRHQKDKPANARKADSCYAASSNSTETNSERRMATSVR